MSWGNLREKYSASLTTSEVVIANISVNNIERLSLEITTDSPLATFVINSRLHSAGAFNELYSSSEDYLSPTGLLIGTSSDLTSLSGTGWLILDTRALELVQLECSAATTAEIEVFAGG